MENELKLQFPNKKDIPKNITDEQLLTWLKNINIDPITGKGIGGNNKLYRFYASEALKRKICYHPILQELALEKNENDKKPLEDNVKFPNNNLIISVFKQYTIR